MHHWFILLAFCIFGSFAALEDDEIKEANVLGPVNEYSDVRTPEKRFLPIGAPFKRLIPLSGGLYGKRYENANTKYGDRSGQPKRRSYSVLPLAAVPMSGGMYGKRAVPYSGGLYALALKCKQCGDRMDFSCDTTVTHFFTFSPTLMDAECPPTPPNFVATKCAIMRCGDNDLYRLDCVHVRKDQLNQTCTLEDHIDFDQPDECFSCLCDGDLCNTETMKCGPCTKTGESPSAVRWESPEAKFPTPTAAAAVAKSLGMVTAVLAWFASNDFDPQ